MEKPKHFYSIEFTNKEGDEEIKHAELTMEEATEWMDRFLEEGMSAKFHRLSRTPEELASEEADSKDVNYVDETTALLMGESD